MTSFTRLSDGWNAEPNAPDPKVRVEGTDLVLSFRMNHRQYPEYTEGDVGELRFARCSRHRLGATNDEGCGALQTCTSVHFGHSHAKTAPVMRPKATPSSAFMSMARRLFWNHRSLGKLAKQ